MGPGRDQKMPAAAFVEDENYGSWADELGDTSPNYVPLPPKLPQMSTTRSAESDDKQHRSPRLSDTSSALQDDDNTSTHSRLSSERPPYAKSSSRRRVVIVQPSERDQAATKRPPDAYPVSTTGRRRYDDGGRTRERRYVTEDDAVTVHRSYRDHMSLPEIVYRRDERRETPKPLFTDGNKDLERMSELERLEYLNKRAKLEAEQKHLLYLEDRARTATQRQQEEENFRRDLEKRNRLLLEETQQEQHARWRYEEDRETAVKENLQRQEHVRRRYEEEEEQIRRMQALQEREYRIADREAKLSQGLLSERDKMSRAHKNVTFIQQSPELSTNSSLDVVTRHKSDDSSARRGLSDYARRTGLSDRMRNNTRAYWSGEILGQVRKEVQVDEDQARRQGMTKSPYDKRTVSRLRKYSFLDMKSKIHEALSPDTLRSHRVPGDINASIMVEWDFYRFLQMQLEDQRPRVDSMLTLTGTVGHAQATTCGAYAQHTWPMSGPLFSALLQTIYDSGYELHSHMGSGRPKRVETSFDWLMHELSLQITHRFDGAETLHIKATGTVEMVEELIQQLAWAGAVFSCAPIGEDVAYARPTVTTGARGGELFLDFETERIRPDDASCWLPLFSGACIAYGFPIPHRHDEVGLEIPLHILAALVGAGHAVEYDGGVVIKGFSNMIVPMTKTSDIVQWHLITSATEEHRLSYREGLGRCGQRALLNQVDLDCLRTTRAILGWCTAAACALGSSEVNYDITDYSRANQAGTSMTFTGGTLGLQQFAVGQLDFQLGAKDGKCHFQRSGPYSRIINAAGKTPIVLYDTSDRRGWLVNATEVILHILHHRNHRETFEVSGKHVDLPSVEPGRSTARDVLLGNAQLDLYDPVDGKHTLKDMVLNCWSLIEFLIDQNVRKDQAPGTALQANFVEKIRGYEYMAIVDERSPFQRKQTTIARSNGGWLDLVHDVDALILFASGFEEVMRPVRDDDFRRMCMKWHRVPKEKDYLAASVKILKDLYDVAGSRLDRKYLTSTRLQWHRGNSTLFESCAMPHSHRCHCDRLQQVLPGSTIGTVTGPGPLIDAYHDGAVIFGQSETRLRPRRQGREEPRVNSIYGQQNTTFVVPDVDNHRGMPSRTPSTTNPPTGNRSTRAVAASDESERDFEAGMRNLTIDYPSQHLSSQRPNQLIATPPGSPHTDLRQPETWSFERQPAAMRSTITGRGRPAEQGSSITTGVTEYDEISEHPRPLMAPANADHHPYGMDAGRPRRASQYDAYLRPASPVRHDRRRRRRSRRSPRRTPSRSPTRRYAPLMLHSGRPPNDEREGPGPGRYDLEDDVKSESSRRYR